METGAISTASPAGYSAYRDAKVSTRLREDSRFRETSTGDLVRSRDRRIPLLDIIEIGICKRGMIMMACLNMFLLDKIISLWENLIEIKKLFRC